MTSWDAEGAEPALHVVARSTASGIVVDWTDLLEPGELADACDGLAAYLDFMDRMPQGAEADRSLPPGHPHAGELAVRGHPDEHRFLDVVLTRHVPTMATYAEPTADERARGLDVVRVVGPEIGPLAPYAPSRCSFGPHRPGGGADGSVVPMAALTAAVRRELERRRP